MSEEKSTNRHLCESCRWYSRVGGDKGEEYRYCSAMSMQVKSVIIRCTDYANRTSMGLGQMERIALYLDENVTGNSKEVGFVWKRYNDTDKGVTL